eukprot:9079022-Pyramimonas_sp.AAC.1
MSRVEDGTGSQLARYASTPQGSQSTGAGGLPRGRRQAADAKSRAIGPHAKIPQHILAAFEQPLALPPLNVGPNWLLDLGWRNSEQEKPGHGHLPVPASPMTA